MGFRCEKLICLNFVSFSCKSCRTSTPHKGVTCPSIALFKPLSRIRSILFETPSFFLGDVHRHGNGAALTSGIGVQLDLIRMSVSLLAGGALRRLSAAQKKRLLFIIIHNQTWATAMLMLLCLGGCVFCIIHHANVRGMLCFSAGGTGWM